MLPTSPNPLRLALNRVTFGARDTDVQNVTNLGWAGWVNDQLGAGPGDDPALSTFLSSQIMHIKYAAPADTDTRGKWGAVDEDRLLLYLNAATPTLWDITRSSGSTYSPAERTRIRQEIAAASWIRNTHSAYQMREFMVDFWHNHFNIGKNENELATSLLPVYDRLAIRPHALGNFRVMLEANATSTSMLIYLDNWVSTAATPNENYAREIMELHTLGGGSYYGTVSASEIPKGTDGVAIGFCDGDIVQASRVLSGWTILYGQRADNQTLPNTGEFAYNLTQHNRVASVLLGVRMDNITNADMSQGRKFLDLIAYHPATASFIVGKLAKRMFGDSPPQAVIDRGVAAWKANAKAGNQIAQVLRAMILDGNEIMTTPATKVRRPYERIIALARTTGMVVNAGTYMTSLLDGLTDGLFAWQAPNGRPDVNAYWTATGATLTTWNLLFQIPNLKEFTSAPLASQSPSDALNTATGIVEYWVGRMVGYQLSPNAMNSLITDQAGSNGVPAAVKSNNASRVETAHRRLISLIATSEEFALR